MTPIARVVTVGPRRSSSPLPALVACLLALAACALVASPRAEAIPSAVVHYGPDLPAGLDQYAAPGNVIVVTAEQRNRYPARLKAWRAKGANVLAYVNLVDWHAPFDPIQQNLYGGSFPSSWFYPGNLSNYPGYKLTNLNDDSPVATYNGFTGTWGQYAARWIRNEVIKDGSIFNGVFLDVWGDQLYNVNVGGPGTRWDAGVARWGAEIRAQVGPGIFLVGNNTQSHATAAPLNGRMWESFESRRSGYNDLTGQGVHPGIVSTFPWPEWDKPRMDILWRNEANPTQDTKNMLNAAAQRVTQTGSDVAVGASNHQGGFPAPFGAGGGSNPPPSSVPPPPPPPPPAPRPTTPTAPRSTTPTAPRSTTPTAPRSTAPAGARTVPSTPAAGGGAIGGASTAPAGTGGIVVVSPTQTIIPGAGGAIGGRRLAFTAFSRGELGSWSKLRSPVATVIVSGDAKGGKAALVTGRRTGAFATLSAPVGGQKGTTTVMRLRVPVMQLPAGGARALMVLGSRDGYSRQVGVQRATSGDLHWALWTRTPDGSRTGIVVANKVLQLETWVTVRATTNWTSPTAHDVLHVGNAVAVRAPAGTLSDRAVDRVTVGLGRAATGQEAAGVLVRAVAVIAR